MAVVQGNILCNDPANTQPNGYRLGVGYAYDKWNGQLMLRGATGRDLAAYIASTYWVVDVAANYKINANLKAYFIGVKRLKMKSWYLKSCRSGCQSDGSGSGYG